MRRRMPRPRQQAPRRATPDEPRIVRAMLFADVKGFSVLNDEQLLSVRQARAGGVRDRPGTASGHVWHRRTWGDAVFVVLTDAVTAALCALDLQDAMASVDLEAEGLPGHLALRLGAHVGPVVPLPRPDRQRARLHRFARQPHRPDRARHTSRAPCTSLSRSPRRSFLPGVVTSPVTTWATCRWPRTTVACGCTDSDESDRQAQQPERNGSRRAPRATGSAPHGPHLKFRWFA